MIVEGDIAGGTRSMEFKSVFERQEEEVIFTGGISSASLRC